MAITVPWKGVYPALLTPFTADDELDLPLFAKRWPVVWLAGGGASDVV